MARQLRIQFPGAVYHVVNRGDGEEPILRDDTDRAVFFETLEQACVKTGWKVFAYCLLQDHFHLFLQTPKANLVHGMKWFLGTYTARLNRRHGWRGHVFCGRYKSQLIDPSELRWHAELADYIHLNSARVKAVETAAALEQFRWSSYPAYRSTSDQRPPWLDISPVLQACGLQDSEEGREQYAQRLEAQRHAPWPESWKAFREGWYVGNTEFRKGLLDRLEDQRTAQSRGLIWKASDEHQAEKLIEHSLQKLGWLDSELARLPKTDPQKLFIARELRRETTMPIRWIAERLKMGTRNTLRNALAEKTPASSNPFRAKRASTSTEPFSTALKTSAPAGIPIPIPVPESSAEGSASMTIEPGWD